MKFIFLNIRQTNLLSYPTKWYQVWKNYTVHVHLLSIYNHVLVCGQHSSFGLTDRQADSTQHCEESVFLFLDKIPNVLKLSRSKLFLHNYYNDDLLNVSIWLMWEVPTIQ